MSAKVQQSEDKNVTTYVCLICGRTFTLPNHRCTKKCPCGSIKVMSKGGYDKLSNGTIVI